MLQMIISAITMVVIYVVIHHLHNKDNVSKEIFNVCASVMMADERTDANEKEIILYIFQDL